MAEERNIKYINREFSDFKTQLIEYAKNYFPDTYNDFSPTSPGMMFIEMAAYVGDVLSFYQDMQLQETFLQYAKNPGNLYDLAYMMGYRPKVTTVSEVDIEITQTVGANGNNPDWSEAVQIPSNTILRASVNGNTPFILSKDVDFNFSSSYDPTEVTIATLAIDGTPESYYLKKSVKAFSGEIVETKININSGERFATFTLDDSEIIGVVDITGSAADNWYEVPFLGQDTVYEEVQNTSSDSQVVPYTLALRRTPKRFVTRFNSTGQLLIQFGAGITGQSDDILTPDPTNIGLGLPLGSQSALGKAFDPSNFLYTGTYGIVPTEELNLRYLRGGGIAANVPANTITQASLPGSLSSAVLSFNNPKPAIGGKDGDTVEEIRQNSMRAFSEQQRAVTVQDYSVRALSLPTKFGSIAKVYVTQDQSTNSNVLDPYTSNNPLALSMYVTAYDVNKKLTPATATLKDNLKKYLSEYMLITDAINIKDAFVVNVGINYEIIVRPNYFGRDILLACSRRLAEYFEISKWNINQPINLSDIYTVLDKVKGVQTVQKIEVVNKVGGEYSQYAYDIKGATRNNIVYPSYDPCIFEVKYPNVDIKGRITTL